MSRFLDEAGLQAYHAKLEERLGSKLDVYQCHSSGNYEMQLNFNYGGLHLGSNILCASATLHPNYLYLSEDADAHQTTYRPTYITRTDDYNEAYHINLPDRGGNLALISDIDSRFKDEYGQYHMNMMSDVGIHLWDAVYGGEAFLNKAYLHLDDGDNYGITTDYRTSEIYHCEKSDGYVVAGYTYTFPCNSGTFAVGTMRSSGVSINSASSTSSRYYPVEINVDGTPFVNVPWTDTKVSYTSTTTNSSYPLLFKYSTGSTTTSAGTRFNTSITANPSTGTITATKFKGNGSELTGISHLSPEGDNRSTATTPNDYFDTIKFTGLKLGTSIGLSDTYAYTAGLRSWSDTSGGDAHEFAFTNSGMYHRQGSSTSWGSWESFAVRGNRNMYEHLVSLTLGNSSTGYLKGTGTLQFRVITHRPASFITSVDAVHTLLQEAGNYLPCYCSYHITSNSSSGTYIGQSAYCYALLRVAGSEYYYLNCSGTYLKSNVPYSIGMTLDYMISAVKVLKTIQI